MWTLILLASVHGGIAVYSVPGFATKELCQAAYAPIADNPRWKDSGVGQVCVETAVAAAPEKKPDWSASTQ